MGTALVTGATAGIGAAFAHRLARDGHDLVITARDAGRLDATAAQLTSAHGVRVEVIAADLSDPAGRQLVVDRLTKGDPVDLLVNNAGIGGGALLGDLHAVPDALDVNFWGTLSMVRAFAPVLAANGGGAIVNIASSASWFVFPGSSAYAVSKAAVWSMSNALRQELAGQGTLVTSVHLGAADTDMVKDLDVPKMDPAEVARRTLDGVEAGEAEVVVDEFTQLVKASLSKDPREFDRQLAQLMNDQ
jgi:short-subunit dehydrogenase